MSAAGRGVSASTWARVRIGWASFGPGLNVIRTPSASSGNRMSEKTIAASSGKRRSGCSDTSTARSGVLHKVRKSTP